MVALRNSTNYPNTGGVIMIQSWETILGIVVVLAILLPIILKKLY
jgi:hypothetical protein